MPLSRKKRKFFDSSTIMSLVKPILFNDCSVISGIPKPCSILPKSHEDKQAMHRS